MKNLFASIGKPKKDKNKGTNTSPSDEPAEEEEPEKVKPLEYEVGGVSAGGDVGMGFSPPIETPFSDE